MNEHTTLVATLGGQPQVVTFTLDLLLEMEQAIEQVVVVYMASSPRYHEAYRRLAGEFAGDRYAGRACHLRSIPIRSGPVTLAEARTPSEVEAVRACFFNLLSDLKGQGQRVHLSLTGGRRIMALTALAAAMQHLTPADKVWHIFTTPELTERARDGAILHAPEDSGVRLIEVPFVPWAAYFPGLKPLLERSPEDLQGLAWLEEGERQRCREVWEGLTRREREVLHLLAQGFTRKQAAERLRIAITTVDTHRKAILRQCERAWGDEEGLHFNLGFLRQRFGPFLSKMA